MGKSKKQRQAKEKKLTIKRLKVVYRDTNSLMYIDPPYSHYERETR